MTAWLLCGVIVITWLVILVPAILHEEAAGERRRFRAEAALLRVHRS